MRCVTGVLLDLANAVNSTRSAAPRQVVASRERGPTNRDDGVLAELLHPQRLREARTLSLRLLRGIANAALVGRRGVLAQGLQRAPRGSLYGVHPGQTVE